MQTVSELRQRGRGVLSESVADPAHRSGVIALEVDVLLAHVLGWTQTEILSRLNDPVGQNTRETFEQLLERRARHEPVAYITGHKEFFGLDFAVTPAVLIPRPETELIVEQALKLITTRREPLRVVDVGTGSGAIIVSVMSKLRQDFGENILRRTQAIAIDIMPDALEIARANARRHEVESLIEFRQGNLLEKLRAPDDTEEIFLVNPPYIGVHEELPPDVGNFEPAQALFAGADGLEVIFQLLEQLASRFAGRSGTLVMEIGHRQRLAVEFALNSIPGISEIEFFADLQGIDRVVMTRWQGEECKIS